MTPTYLAAMVTSVLALVAVRILVPALPARRWSRPIGRVAALLVLLGVVGLVVHCSAMFARPFASGVPGVSALVGPIDALGPLSVLLFAVPATLLLVGLHGQRWPVVSVLLLALVAVGVTMYDGGPVRVHLVAIFAAVVILAATLLLFVGALDRGRPVRRR